MEEQGMKVGLVVAGVTALLGGGIGVGAALTQGTPAVERVVLVEPAAEDVTATVVPTVTSTAPPVTVTESVAPVVTSTPSPVVTAASVAPVTSAPARTVVTVTEKPVPPAIPSDGAVSGTVDNPLPPPPPPSAAYFGPGTSPNSDIPPAVNPTP